MNTAEAMRLANTLLTEHPRLVAAGWKIKWAPRAKRLRGQTQFGPRIITLNREWTERNDEADVRNNITHEIAHALVGHKAGHGIVWQMQHRALGGDGKRLDETTAPLEGRYRGECPAGHTVYAHRRLKNWTRSCNYCRPKHFDRRYLIAWTDTVTGARYGRDAEAPRRLVDLNSLTTMSVSVDGGPEKVVARKPAGADFDTGWTSVDAMWGY
jgi:SprT protein